MDARSSVHIVSHGPGCLDGLVSAVVLARTLETDHLSIEFPAPRDIDFTLRNFSPRRPEHTELWVTDISWANPETSAHLAKLIDAGMALYWMDHHKSALDRIRKQGLGVEPTDYVLDMDRCGSKIVWDYLRARTDPGSDDAHELAELEPLVSLTDDVDRWLLQIDGSRDVALAISALSQDDAFDVLMDLDADLSWPANFRRAQERVRKEIVTSLELAVSTQRIGNASSPRGPIPIVVAECIGYSGEVADRWKADFSKAVFALFDRRAQAVSLRRCDDCPVDLSTLAAAFGGGGHAAAAGFDPPTTIRGMPAIVQAIVEQLDQQGASL